MVASDGAIKVESSKGPWAASAACSAQGPRPQNEDVHVMICDGLPEGPAPNIKAAGLPGLFDDLPELVSGPSLPAVEKPQCTDCLFAVFDGHGGISAARACAERIPTEIREELDAAGRDTPEARQAAVAGTYLALDRHLRIKLGPAARECGTTCVFAYVWKKEDVPSTYGVLLANLGDSRALVLKSRKNGGPASHELVGETKDHTPSAPEEEKRIRAAGGKVEVFPGSKVPVMRVDGYLGCSRALGDFRFKEDAALLPEQQKVSAVPEVYEFECQSGDVIVLGCDGVFDVLSSSKAASLVSKELRETGDPTAAAKSIVKAALSDPRQQDNVTCVVALIQ
ncbi:Protein phosphatase 1A [Symbiodinium microadriaticum]|uniref:protein-serine/threonine phosphatase n=3 Tax=Symbiodinium TaxID=2949 RepID=A0A1Q9CUG1_SYMMI|nr:Protein phosphatase 1A [Symbiodinium microadriaticum]